MKTRTTIETPSSEIKISHEDCVITFGSCFADLVGNKLESLKYSGSFNPLGIFYNPVSIHKALQSIELDLSPNPALYCSLDGACMHHDYHSQVSSSSKEKYLEHISQINKTCKKKIKNAHLVIITLGSSFVYEHINSGKIIANCHKQDASEFKRRLLTYEECKDTLKQIVELLLLVNPNIHIVLTVSPIRHVRDTLIGNSKSKAILLNAIHHIIDHYDVCEYFPAYEIMIDDLRDYRYYEDDMIHPSSKAFGYIWELFSSTYITTASQEANKRIEKILKAVQHRPFRKGTSSHLAFIESTLNKIKELEQDYPNLDWRETKKHLLNSK